MTHHMNVKLWHHNTNTELTLTIWDWLRGQPLISSTFSFAEEKQSGVEMSEQTISTIKQKAQKSTTILSRHWTSLEAGCDPVRNNLSWWWQQSFPHAQIKQRGRTEEVTTHSLAPAKWLLTWNLPQLSLWDQDTVSRHLWKSKPLQLIKCTHWRHMS